MRITRLALFVAPHAGAWIETQPASPESCIRVTSRLTQARGLKRRVSCHLPIANKVAPHAGAWIETCENKTLDESLSVAPHAGADRKSTRLNSSHVRISYAVFCLKKKKKRQ